MTTTPTLILMAITHTPMVIMVIRGGDGVTMVPGVRVTGVMVDGVTMVHGVMVDGVTMVLGVRVTGVRVGIADNTFSGQLYYICNNGTVPFYTLNDRIG